MNWSDEKYVKLYVRDSLTWLSWPWEARACWPLLLRKLDGAGLIETGRGDQAAAVALQILMPVEVVKVGLPAILASGTLEVVTGGLVSPAFVEAQEARKTEAQKKRDQRERVRDQRRAQQVFEIRNEPVPTPSPSVPRSPPPAQPSPSPTPSPLVAGKKPPAPRKPKRGEGQGEEKPVDPRHAPLRLRLIEIFRLARGIDYPFGPRDAAAVRDLLAKGEPDVIADAWARALQHRGFPTVSTLGELVQHLAHFIGAGAPSPGKPDFDPNQGIIRSGGPPPVDRDRDHFPWVRS